MGWPACPGWTVHDVVAHLSGAVDDALQGRMEGAPSPAWTARQVEARHDQSVAAILAEWERSLDAPERDRLEAQGYRLVSSGG